MDSRDPADDPTLQLTASVAHLEGMVAAAHAAIVSLRRQQREMSARLDRLEREYADLRQRDRVRSLATAFALILSIATFLFVLAV